MQLWHIEWELGEEPDLAGGRVLARRKWHGHGVAVLVWLATV